MAREPRSAEQAVALQPDPPPRIPHNKTPPDVVETILALHIAGHPLPSISRELDDMPISTIHGIIKRAENEKSETLASLRMTRKNEWVGNAWGVVNKLTQAATKGAERIAEQVEAGERDLTPRDIQSLAVATGIYHDKIALITGEGAAGQGNAGSVAEVASAVLGAWESGRQAGIKEATPRRVVSDET